MHSDECKVREMHWVAECKSGLTHWGRVTHICVGKLTIIGSNNGLLPERRQAIIWTNAGILLIGLQWNINRNSNIFIEENTFENVVCEMLFISYRPQCVNPITDALAIDIHKTCWCVGPTAGICWPRSICCLMVSLAWSLTKLQWVSTCEVVQLWGYISCKPLGFLEQLPMYSWLSWVSSYRWVSAREI